MQLLSITRQVFGTRKSLEPYKGVVTQNFIDILEANEKLGPKQSEILADHLLRDMGMGALVTKYKLAKSNITQKLDNAAKAIQEAIDASKGS